MIQIIEGVPFIKLSIITISFVAYSLLMVVTIFLYLTIGRYER